MFEFVGPVSDVHLHDYLRAVGVAVAVIVGMSFVREPVRQRSMAITVAVAAGAYMNGGLGAWELVFATVVAVLAYHGLHRYKYIALAWLLHTGWDLMHHYTGQPLISWLPTSAMDCAVTDAILAAWFFAGAPDVRHWFTRRTAAAAGDV